MWFERSLAVLVLLTLSAALTTSESQTTSGPHEPSGHPASWSRGLLDSANIGSRFEEWMASISSITTNIRLTTSDEVEKNTRLTTDNDIDKVTTLTTDGDVYKNYIEKVYERALDELKNMKWSCVRGLLHENKGGDRMKTWDGRVMDITDTVNLEVHNKKVTEDGSVTAEVLFKYPELILTSDFQYNSTVAGVAYSKTGTVKIRIGPPSVTVSVKMPNSKETIKAEPDKEKCMNTITPDEITSSTEHFEVIDVVYPNTFKFKSFSHRYMFNMFNDMQNDILKNLKDYLEHHVALSVKDIAFSCLDANAAEKWKPLKPDDYCKEPSPTTEKSG